MSNMTTTDDKTGVHVELRSIEGRKPWLVIYYFADGRAKILSDHDSQRAANKWAQSW